MKDNKKVDKKAKKSGKKANSERWLMILVVAVLVVIVAVIAWSVTSRRAPTPQDARTADTTTDAVPSTPASSTPASTPAATPSPAVPVGITVGKSAPDFTLKDLSGNSISLHQFRGHVVILDFWASWCAPCRASMPTLDGFASRYHDKGLVLIGVSLDRSAENARSFLNANNYHRLIALWESASASQAVAREYGVNAIPHTFVLDRDGIIRFTDHPMRLTTSLLDSLFK